MKLKKYSQEWRRQVIPRPNPQPISIEKTERRRVLAYAASLRAQEKKLGDNR